MNEKSVVAMPPLLLRPEEAATLLGIGRTRVFDLIRSGELRSVKIGNSRRVSPGALAEFVEGLGADDLDRGMDRRAV